MANDPMQPSQIYKRHEAIRRLAYQLVAGSDLGLFASSPEISEALSTVEVYVDCFICGSLIELITVGSRQAVELERMWIACSRCKEATRAEAAEERLKAFRSMPYREYLLTPHWRAVRLGALERDGNACRLCGSGDSLNVHHRTYERLGDEDPNDLVTLCQPCHALFHDNRKLAAPAAASDAAF